MDSPVIEVERAISVNPSSDEDCELTPTSVVGAPEDMCPHEGRRNASGSPRPLVKKR